jgi:hypothetical protein
MLLPFTPLCHFEAPHLKAGNVQIHALEPAQVATMSQLYVRQRGALNGTA